MLRSTVLSIVLVMIGGMSAQAETFLKHAADVPVIEGFGETPALGSAFERPDGRIVEAWLTGFKPADEALVLYKATLPQLGWDLESEVALEGAVKPTLTFLRGAERLSIAVAATGDGLAVLKVEISPLAN